MSAYRKRVDAAVNAVDHFRQSYIEGSRERVGAVDPKIREAAVEKKRTAIACLAASLLLHDRAVYVHRQAIDKVRNDFIATGMVLPGMRMVFVNDRPVAIPLDE